MLTLIVMIPNLIAILIVSHQFLGLDFGCDFTIHDHCYLSLNFLAYKLPLAAMMWTIIGNSLIVFLTKNKIITIGKIL